MGSRLHGLVRDIAPAAAATLLGASMLFACAGSKDASDGGTLPDGELPVPGPLPMGIPRSCVEGSSYWEANDSALCSSGPTYFLCVDGKYSVYACESPGTEWACSQPDSCGYLPSSSSMSATSTSLGTFATVTPLSSASLDGGTGASSGTSIPDGGASTSSPDGSTSSITATLVQACSSCSQGELCVTVTAALDDCEPVPDSGNCPAGQARGGSNCCLSTMTSYACWAVPPGCDGMLSCGCQSDGVELTCGGEVFYDGSFNACPPFTTTSSSCSVVKE